MFSKRLEALSQKLQRNAPASDAAIAETIGITGAVFPDDLLAFMRFSNGAIADLPAFGFMRLNPIEEWPADTIANEAPRNVWIIGSDGSGGAYCWDQRRKGRQFVHASTDGFKVWKKMGATFEELLEALIEWGKQQQAAAGGQKTKAVADAETVVASPLTITAASAPLLPPIPLLLNEPEPLNADAAAAARRPAEVFAGIDPGPALFSSAGKPPAHLQAKAGVALKLKAGEMVPWGGIALSSNVRLAATAIGDPAAPMSGDLLVHVWDLGTKKSLKQVAMKDKLLLLTFTPDARRLLTITIRSTGVDTFETVLIDLLSERMLLRSLELTTKAAYAPPTPAHTGGLLASIAHLTPAGSACACVRDIATGKTLFSTPCEPGGIAITPDGTRVVVGGKFGSAARLFDVDSGKFMAWCQFPLDENEPCSISADGCYVATTTTGVHPPRGMVADLSNGKVLRDFPKLTAHRPQAAALLDGGVAAVHTHSGILHVVSLQTGETVGEYECTKKANSVYLAKAGAYLLAGADTSKSITLYRI